MIYLKKFNENNKETYLANLQDMCREHMIDLIDKDFDISCPYNTNTIEIQKNYGTNGYFNWRHVDGVINNFLYAYGEELNITDMRITYRNSHKNRSIIPLSEIKNFNTGWDILHIAIHFKPKN